MASIKRNFLANFAGKVWVGALALALLPVYLKFLGAEAFGLVGLYMSLSAALAMFDLGLYTTLNRELARLSARDDAREQMRNLLRSAEAVHWCIAALIGCALVAGAPLIAGYWLKSEILSPETLQPALRLAGLAIAFQWPSGLYAAGLTGVQNQVSLNVATGIVATARGVGAVLVLWLHSPTAEAFFAWHLVCGLLLTVTLGILLWRSLPQAGHRPRFDLPALVRLGRFSLGAWGIAFSTNLLVQVDKIVLSAVLPLATFGFYSAASMVSNSLYYLLGPITASVFPRFAQLADAGSRQELARTYHKSCQLAAVATLPWAVLVALFPSEVLSLWTGNAELAAKGRVVLVLLVSGTALNALVQLPYCLQLADGRVRLGFHANVVALVVGVPSLIASASRYAAPGGAAVWLFLNLGLFAIVAPLMHRSLSVDSRRWLAVDTMLPLAASLPVVGLARWFLPEGLPGLESAFCLGAALASAYVGAILAAPDTRSWALGWINWARGRLTRGQLR